MKPVPSLAPVLAPLRASALALAAGACAARGPQAIAASPPAARGSVTGTAADTTADTVRLVLAATTDVHGHLRAWDYLGARPDSANSLAAAATVVDSLRRAHAGRVVLVDAGDMLQGTALTDVAARQDSAAAHPVPAAMNAMGYDAAAVGNHEFNYGLPLVERVRAQARFPLLAANARTPDGRRAFPAFTIVRRDGVAVGIVGATTPGAMVWDRDHLRGRLTIGDVVPAVRLAADSVRRAGADVVVAVVHSGRDGPSSYDTVSTGLPSENVAGRLAAEVPGLDAVVFGHSHRQLVDTTPGRPLLLQAKNWAASVAVAELRLARAGGAHGRGAWRVVGRDAALVPVRGRAELPAVLAATEAAHARAQAYVASPLGTTPVAWRADSARVADAAVTDLVLEVMRRRAGADLAATAVFSLDAGLAPGAVTVADVARLYPYENTLRAVRVTGAQLRAFLEHSARYFRTHDPADGSAPVFDPQVPGFNFDVVAGADFVLDVSRPVGQRVTRLAVRGRAVADADTFTLALNNYRQTGGGGFAMLAGAPVVYDRDESIRELLSEEIRGRATIRPADYHTVNWRLEPAGAVARAYAAGRGAAGGARATGATPVTTTSAPVVDTAPRVRKDAPQTRGGRARTLRVIAINDFHGALEPRPDARGVRRGGAGPLAAAIAEARAGCRPPACTSVLLDAGDEFQGTPASNLVYGRPVVALYRALGVDASALGNHEFDWGVDTLRARIREVPYAVLGANVRTTDGQRLPWLRDDTLIVRNGVRIGVVGVADPATPRTTSVLNLRGLRFDPPAPAIDARARALRARGADVVLVTAHIGGFCDADRDNDPGAGGAASGPAECSGEIFDLARELTEPIAAIVSGHTHSRVATVVNGIPIVQSRSSGRGLAWVDVPLDRAGPGTPVFREVVADSAGPVPPAVAAIVRRAASDVEAQVSRQVATLADALPREPDEQYALGNLIADAQRAAGRGDVAIVNNGGIRTGLQAGPLTFGALFEAQPFGNKLYRLTVSGSDLKAYLPSLVSRNRPRWHVSGLLLTYDSTRTGADRLRSATLADGSAIAADRRYVVILPDFLVAGGDGMQLAARAASTEPTTVVDRDALAAYLGALPQPVRPPTEERIRAVGGAQ
jgi:2',3'-cyclic-nucleotide 2'-phosphodiesterase (5'-nucleotidase family)